MTVSQATDAEENYAERAALTTLFGNGPRVKILAVLLAQGRDANATTIADVGGMSRSSVYRHIDTLIDLGVVEQTREVSGSPLYQIDRESPVAERLAQLEYELVDVVADEGAESDTTTNPEDTDGTLEFPESPPS
ncbi:ArsR/SmtB family transcription factor [Halobaculum sp. MBLA0147]|uniref:ArsR/SmtB family transcription factor n=1 Tax=Halobaculum sp. MBLA0147 TaxID=3079934 RepID=UPI00352326FD